MKPPDADRTLDVSLTGPMLEAVARYEAALRAIPPDGERPGVQGYLDTVPESDRPTLRSVLVRLVKPGELPTDNTSPAAVPSDAGSAAVLKGDTVVATTSRSDTDLDFLITPSEPRVPTPAMVPSHSTAGTVSFAPDEKPGAGADATVGYSPPPRKGGPTVLPVVPGYEILGELGRGGMGVVYRARDVKLNRVVALKMVLAGAHAGPEQLARFFAEAESVAQLVHPNIVQIYGIGEHDGLPYFSLEFVDGGSLSEKLDRKPMHTGKAAALMATLARAVAGAHAHGVIHRDLKPANVLMTTDGVPKITDFGLAKRLESDSSQTRSGTLMGTPNYMAPEQARGDTHAIGPLADVYALGVMLYECLTGRTPFVGTSIVDTLQQVQNLEPVPPSRLQPRVPTDLETICLKCLQKEQAKRYVSALALAEDVDRFIAGQPILARPIGTVERAWRWAKRNPRIAVLSAAVLLLLVTVAVGSSVMAYRISLEHAAAVDARILADQKAKAEQEARELADLNAKVANDQADLAVRTFYQVVFEVQNQLRDRPDMQNLRAKLLKDAMAGLDAVAKSAENTNLLQRTSGGAYQRMGDVALEIGDTPGAGRHYERALRIYEQLAAVEPKDDRNPWSLAVMYEKVGTVNHRLGGDVNKTRDFYHRATEIREALAKKGSWSDPRITQVLVDNALAGSYAAEANLALLMGNPALALQYFQSALPLRQQLADANDKDLQAQEALATLYVTMGQVHFHLRKAAESEGDYRQSLTIREKLVKADTHSVPFKKGLVDSHQKIGDMLLHLKGKEALDTVREEYKAAHGLQTELYDQNPSNKEMQQALASSFYRLGTVAARFGEKPESQKYFQECMKLRDVLAKGDPTNLYKQVELALAQARCGEVEKVAATAKRIRTDAAKDGSILYYIGCCFALCSAATEEQTKRAEYAREAVATLRQAIARGYDDRVSLETDPDLESLQDLPDYKEMVQQLKQH
jgi:serine/threonine-protein kinase